jgi:hypothetical protein
LVLLSLITTKQRHYALILLPATAPATGWWLSLMMARRGFPKPRMMEITCGVIAIAASAYLEFIQPKSDDEGGIPGFMQRTEALTAESTEAWTRGKMPWCTEFYFQCEVPSMGSVTKAWRRVPPDGTMVAIQQGKPLKGIEQVDGELLLDETRGNVRCQLFLSPVATE